MGKAAHAVTPLAGRLARRIAAEGPMTVAEYMAACLLDAEHGYYTTREPFGRAGDFVTAPEISQMFGELIGLCLAQAWADQGAPDRVLLVELGPGRGTLMDDLMRAAGAVPAFRKAAEVHLVEASPRLRALQARRLAQHRPVWHDDLVSVPEGPVFLVANEFLDALPIRQFQRAGEGWAERVVGLRDGALAFGLTPPAPLADLAYRLPDTVEGDVVETCAAAQGVAAEIGTRIASHGGVALIVDYGGWRSRGDTLQALHQGACDDPLAHPGAADLTAHVDFEPLARAARAAGAATARLTPQGAFLERLGIVQRGERLARDLTGAALKAFMAAHRRLTHPEEMGTLFQVLAIYPRDGRPPPGLDPEERP